MTTIPILSYQWERSPQIASRPLILDTRAGQPNQFHRSDYLWKFPRLQQSRSARGFRNSGASLSVRKWLLFERWLCTFFFAQLSTVVEPNGGERIAFKSIMPRKS